MTLRTDALAAVKAAIGAANPEHLITQQVRLQGPRLVVGHVSFNLSRYDRILVIGGGKASIGMVAGIEHVLGSWITDGVVSVPEYGIMKTARRVNFNPATHPLPSMKGVEGVKKMLSLIGTPHARDLVICLISGGASSMMPLPTTGMSVSD